MNQTQIQGQAMRRGRPKPRLAEVVSVEQLTPHMVRVLLTGEELAGFESKGPAEHLKVFLPAPGDDHIRLPEWGPEGPVLAGGQSRPLNRTYTPRRWDAERRELAVDFLLHGEGPGSTWAQQARAGQVVALSGQLGGAYRMDPEASSYLIAGDEAALPGVATILEALPAGASARVFVEVADASEELAMDSPAKIDITWLHHGSVAGQVGRGLERAIANASIGADTRVWVGCEAAVMRDIRRALIERGTDKTHMLTQGYWKYGATNHPDNDRGQDVE
jgi:NADPH-dependent ferric siderophore reductase